MAISLFRPFKEFIFRDDRCFLSGEAIPVGNKLMVFPQWLSAQYHLNERLFKLLDESIITYQEIQIPCSDEVKGKLDLLEQEISIAFNSGYEEVKQLDELKLFQWIGKLVYGVIYHEIATGIKQQSLTGEGLNFSQSLMHKFGNFHLMLQSIISPVEFEGDMPWSISIFHVDNEPDAFSYRDEINTLTFSLRMNDFGIIACLQDNGMNKEKHAELLEKVAFARLHPIQFEELCARFFYSSYLFNRLPEYTVLETPEKTYIEAMPLRSVSNTPVFDQWQVKTYGQVLENFWKQWGYNIFEIIQDPEKPMTFLLDDQGEFNSSPQVQQQLS